MQHITGIARNQMVFTSLEESASEDNLVRFINKANAENLGVFIRCTIKKEAKITTDECTGYKPLDKEFENRTHIKSGEKGENFPELHRVIMNFKGWLRGLHHQVGDLQEYLNEYTYRFNRSFMNGNIFDNLLHRMIKTPSCTAFAFKN